jgi:ribosomal protein S18 acetylase RimI-like enzyme
MEEIRPLTDNSIDCLFTAREAAFKGYVRTWSKAEYEKMLNRRGYVPSLSFGAFDGTQLVSFTLNGIGLFNGTRAAYDTGTGTIPEYRGKGLAAKIFVASLPFLKQAGMEQYVLEVLLDNSKAISVYSKLGFTVSRKLNYFVQDMHSILPLNKSIQPGITLHETDLSQKPEMQKFWDFLPSWQNCFASISRNLADFRIIGAFHDGALIGYGIIEKATGDVPQIAVHNVYRRRGIGTGILKELLMFNRSPWHTIYQYRS